MTASSVSRSNRSSPAFSIAKRSPVIRCLPPSRRWRVPHSRLNDLPEPALRAGGYRVLTRSATAGVMRSSKRMKNPRCSSSFRVTRNTRPIHCCANTAATSAGSCVASAAQDYFNNTATFLADDFRMRAIGQQRGDLVGDFPMEPLATGTENTWRNAAAGLYRNWINYLQDRKPDRKSLAVTEAARRVSA
jgi:homoserine O-succinyltransferase